MTEQVLQKNPFIEYWMTIWSGITTTFAGMKVTLKYMLSKPTTMHYPEERPKIHEFHRGLHMLDTEACKLCMACARACPVMCIDIQGERKGRDIEIFVFDIDLSKCLFCNLCAEACTTDCIWLGEQWDMSAYSREGCVLQLANMDPEYARAHKWQTLKDRDAEREARKQASAQKKGDA